MIDQPMTEHDPMTDYVRALAYAHAAHAGQLRKGTDTPYISHRACGQPIVPALG